MATEKEIKVFLKRHGWHYGRNGMYIKVKNAIASAYRFRFINGALQYDWYADRKWYESWSIPFADLLVYKGKLCQMRPVSAAHIKKSHRA